MILKKLASGDLAKLLKMAVEIVSFPTKHVDLTHGYVSVYQRVRFLFRIFLVLRSSWANQKNCPIETSGKTTFPLQPTHQHEQSPISILGFLPRIAVLPMLNLSLTSLIQMPMIDDTKEKQLQYV